VDSRAAEERVGFFLLERSWPISIYEMGFFVSCAGDRVQFKRKPI
jgi:hypothetical protein